MDSASFCLLQEKEMLSLIEQFPEMVLKNESGMLHLTGSLDAIAEAKKRFPSFFYGEGKMEEVLQKEFVQRKRTLVLAESCTGGAVAARLVQAKGASQYLMGSMVVYSNSWKERFLHVSRTTLANKGAVSKETAIEMVRGLLEETDADFAAAVTGSADPGEGTVFIAIAERGTQIDAGKIFIKKDRIGIIEEATGIILGALWRRLVHNENTFL